MAHDRNDRRPRLERGFRIVVLLQAGFDIGFGNALQAVTEFADHELGGVGVDALIDGRHHAHLHQRLDHIAAALGHAVGELLNGDGLGHDDVADDLRLLLQHLQRTLLLALAMALNRSKAALALFVIGVDRASDGQLGVAAVVVAARRGGGTTGWRRTRTRVAAGRLFLGLFLDDLDLAGRGQRRDFRRGGLAGAIRDLAARVLVGLFLFALVVFLLALVGLFGLALGVVLSRLALVLFIETVRFFSGETRGFLAFTLAIGV